MLIEWHENAPKVRFCCWMKQKLWVNTDWNERGSKKCRHGNFMYTIQTHCFFSCIVIPLLVVVLHPTMPWPSSHSSLLKNWTREHKKTRIFYIYTWIYLSYIVHWDVCIGSWSTRFTNEIFYFHVQIYSVMSYCQFCGMHYNNGHPSNGSFTTTNHVLML